MWAGLRALQLATGHWLLLGNTLSCGLYFCFGLLLIPGTCTGTDCTRTRTKSSVLSTVTFNTTSSQSEKYHPRVTHTRQSHPVFFRTKPYPTLPYSSHPRCLILVIIECFPLIAGLTKKVFHSMHKLCYGLPFPPVSLRVLEIDIPRNAKFTCHIQSWALGTSQ